MGEDYFVLSWGKICVTNPLPDQYGTLVFVLTSFSDSTTTNGIFLQAPLHYACRRGHAEVVSTLLKNKADVELLYDDQVSVFMWIVTRQGCC